jgi:hypothetical protein
MLGPAFGDLIDNATRPAKVIHGFRDVFQTQAIQVIGDSIEDQRLRGDVVGIIPICQDRLKLGQNTGVRQRRHAEHPERAKL